MLDRGRWISGGIRIESDPVGRAALTAPGYHRPLPYPVSFLDKLDAAYPGPALVEEMLLAEEPGRFAARVEQLLDPSDRTGRALHWGSAALGATVAIARLGLRLDAADANPLYLPLAKERLDHLDLGSTIRLVSPEALERTYDILILVGERLLRPTLPSNEEVAALLRLLSPGGKVVLLGWPRSARAHPLDPSWEPIRRPSRRFAFDRVLRPRGAAPVPTLCRRAFGCFGAPFAMAIPGLIPRIFGEDYGVFQQAPPKSRHRAERS